ncbi:MAG: transposase [[Clostridium] spiroforme]|uniref:Transposase n=1 Tax=Thomasclavelia spiroformis TaxID=29348 RepID=A0A943EIU5_9FIRM|nr:transposase [Thomasclavelia spiroformis]
MKDPICPYCGRPSQKCHSKYKKSFNDLPMHGKNVVIEIINRKMFCNNPNCSHKTFAETYDFIERSQKKTKRLIQHIIDTSKNMSSILAQNTLRKSGGNVGKSTICSFLKK